MSNTSPPHLKVTPDKVITFPSGLYTTANGLITIQNVCETKQPVAFKIKTTAPKKYLVRPSAGIIKFADECAIQLILQNTEEVSRNSNDRFLIQSSILENDTDGPLPKDFWANVDKHKVQDRRLLVSFEDKNNVTDGTGSVNANMMTSTTDNNSLLPPSPRNTAAAGGGRTGAGGGGTAYTTAASNAQNIKTQNMGRANAPTSSSFSPSSNIQQHGEYTSGGGGGGGESISSSSSLNPSEVKQKYEELVQYCLAVEKQKNSLQKENENLKQKINAMEGHQAPSRSLVEAWHVIPLLLGAFMLAKIFGYI